MWKDLKELGTLALLGLGATVVAIVLAMASSSKAGEAYCYTTVDHVFSCTDDSRLIPPMYQTWTDVVQLEGMADYRKLTVSAPYRFNTARLNQLRLMNAMADAQAQRAKAAQAQREAAIALPIIATREMRWVEGHLGYSGRRYIAVDVLRDAKGRTITEAPTEIGVDAGALVAGGLR